MSKPLALIVEDDSALSDLFCRALKSTGYETLSARDGLDAEQKLASVTPDLILLDLHLPKKDGTEILASIQQDPRFKKTKVVVASSDSELASQFRNSVSLVLNKPVGYSQLRELSTRFHAESKSAPNQD